MGHVNCNDRKCCINDNFFCRRQKTGRGSEVEKLKGSYLAAPPSMVRQIPLTNDASSEARYKYPFAISSGTPHLPSGMLGILCLRTSSGIRSVIAVVINPGAMQLTVILYRPSSMAHTFVIPIIADLVA